jgi:hypothetical protein
MRFRAARCRRLAKDIPDDRIIKSLLAMAQEMEADANRLDANLDN